MSTNQLIGWQNTIIVIDTIRNNNNKFRIFSSCNCSTSCGDNQLFGMWCCDMNAKITQNIWIVCLRNLRKNFASALVAYHRMAPISDVSSRQCCCVAVFRLAPAINKSHLHTQILGLWHLRSSPKLMKKFFFQNLAWMRKTSESTLFWVIISVMCLCVCK